MSIISMVSVQVKPSRTRLKFNSISREAYIERMREQMEVMQSTMTKNVATLQEMSTKNMKFIEDSLKMARKEADEKQKQMVEIVKNVQERNAKLAKGKCVPLSFGITWPYIKST